MHVPGWHDATRELQAAGRFQMVGIIQEQHPDRARLFMQWKGMGWPILVDSLNLLNTTGLHLASDEGVITILYLYFWRESAINLGWLMNAHIPQTILVTS